MRQIGIQLAHAHYSIKKIAEVTIPVWRINHLNKGN